MSTTPTIRTAGPEDLSAVQRLVKEGGGSVDDQVATTIPGSRYLLVLDAPDGGLAAAAQLVIEGKRGHLGMLSVARRFEGKGIEDRLFAVIEAMCDAFGVDTLDVPPRRAA
jgi:N-acetylglutamate synthase-like GNAT family acetyltransferase